MRQRLFARWQANFLAGLAIVLPGIISIALLVWLFGTVASITDTLLLFLPRALTHQNHGEGPMYWYWSLAALGLAVCLVCAVGLLARYYFGKRIVEWVDATLLQVPLLNKIYSTIKQVNDAVSTKNKTSFRTVVLVEFPRPGMYSMGFVTVEQQGEIRSKLGQKMVGVFIPTTPNPTSGFLVMVPEEGLVKLEMSVADGIKYIISLGTILPEGSLAPPPVEGKRPGGS